MSCPGVAQAQQWDKKYCISGFSPFLCETALQVMCPVLTTCTEHFQKCFLKKKSPSPTQSKLPISQRTGDRYLDLPQVFVVKVLKGVNEVLLHLHVQRVFHFRELPHGLPHLTKRRAQKGRTKLLYVTEQTQNAFAMTVPITEVTLWILKTTEMRDSMEHLPENNVFST